MLLFVGHAGPISGTDQPGSELDLRGSDARDLDPAVLVAQAEDRACRGLDLEVGLEADLPAAVEVIEQIDGVSRLKEVSREDKTSDLGTL